MNPDFRDMLSALNAAAAEYLVVGAYALAAHGLPRATGDIDLWVNPTPANATRVHIALAQFGAPMGQISVADLTTADTVFQIGVAPRRVDILTGIDGVVFADAWARRVTIALDGMEVAVLSRADLLANKRAAGRPQDLADVAWIERDDAKKQ